MERRPPSICSHYPCNPISFSLSVSLSRSLALVLSRSHFHSYCRDSFGGETHINAQCVRELLRIHLHKVHFPRSMLDHHNCPCSPVPCSPSIRWCQDPPPLPAWAHNLKGTRGFRSTFIQCDVSDRHMTLNVWQSSRCVCVRFMKKPLLHWSACNRSPARVLNMLVCRIPPPPTAADVGKGFWGSGRNVKSIKSYWTNKHTKYYMFTVMCGLNNYKGVIDHHRSA